MNELDSAKLMPLLRSLRTATKQLECAQDNLGVLTDSLLQLIGVAGIRELDKQNASVDSPCACRLGGACDE